MKILKFVVAIALGGLIGAVSAWGLPQTIISGGAVKLGPWQTALAIGVEATNPYERAWVARHGIWALPRSEVIYLSADVDSDGAPLRTGCRYLIEGEEQPARWWSLAAYREDFWMDNPLDRYSITSSQLGEGDWAVTFAKEAPSRDVAGVWLPMDDGEGALNLTLRLYDPLAEVSADPSTIPVPAIRRVACR